MMQEDYISAKYHLAVTKRLFENYGSYSEKRLIVGVINELARASSKIIRAYLLHEKKRQLKDFIETIGLKYLDKLTIDNLVKILEIERAQKISPVEFAKGNKIILLVDSKYKILTVDRLGEFIESCQKAIERFPRQI